MICRSPGNTHDDARFWGALIHQKPAMRCSSQQGLFKLQLLKNGHGCQPQELYWVTSCNHGGYRVQITAKIDGVKRLGACNGATPWGPELALGLVVAGHVIHVVQWTMNASKQDHAVRAAIALGRHTQNYVRSRKQQDAPSTDCSSATGVPARPWPLGPPQFHSTADMTRPQLHSCKLSYSFLKSAGHSESNSMRCRVTGCVNPRVLACKAGLPKPSTAAFAAANKLLRLPMTCRAAAA